jgi:hypothetical protein
MRERFFLVDGTGQPEERSGAYRKEKSKADFGTPETDRGK